MWALIRDAERRWHDDAYTHRGDDGLVVAPEVLRRYDELSHPHLFHLERQFQLVGDVRGKRALYLGCGDESSSILLARKGAEVLAMDLSLEALQRQRKMASANAVAGRIHCVVAAAEQLPFRSGSIDVVFGIGIWHHLQQDLATPCAEVSRVLKDDTSAFFSEPIARSRFLRWARSLFHARTDMSPACTPLRGDALDCFRRYFDVEAYPYLVFARLDPFLTGRPLEFTVWWRRWMIYCFHWLDYLISCVPAFQHLGAAVVLKLKNRRC